jgi:hypothetical protein
MVPHMLAPSLSSLIVFLAIVGAVIAALVYGAYATLGKRPALLLGTGVFLWLAVLALVVRSGFLEAQPLPRLMIFVAVVNLAALVLAFSPLGRALSTLPTSYLVAFQAFRLPLELLIHAWVVQRVIPGTMTWTGLNFDIATGALAIVAAPLAGKSKIIAWAFNIVGFALLLNVVFVALLSSPLPFAWPVTPPLELAFHVPEFLILPVCVAGALAGHLILTRKLIVKASA